MVGNSVIISFQETDRDKVKMVGGKGANLGELRRIGGIHVPDGFCITTEAYKTVVEENQLVKKLLEQLFLLDANDREEISKLSLEIRNTIEGIAIPESIRADIFDQLEEEGAAYAVRSSATAEDLPTASFAGQQDTYLNVIGKNAVLKHISKCWASLFTERAIVYRIQNEFEHDKVLLSVIIQEMVFPQVAGIMFTADPVNGNRKVLSIDASFGLGDALVSGLVNADVYKVRDHTIIDKKIGTKKVAINVQKSGGTREQDIDAALQQVQALTDKQILELEQIGRKIETHFGCPQDIEWCLADDRFYIVQSRPITTLFPIPEIGDEKDHVYLSVAHQQMMTDAMKPLGLSLFQLTAAGAMYTAGGRLFVDIARQLAMPAGRQAMLNMAAQHDPLIKDALEHIIEREFIPIANNNEQPQDNSSKGGSPLPQQKSIGNDPAIAANLIKNSEVSLATLKQAIQNKHGSELFDFILEDVPKLKEVVFSQQSMAAIMAGINAAFWLNDKMKEWLGEKNAADVLSQSAPNNITSEMGLDLLHLADVIRPHAKVIAYLQATDNDNFLNELEHIDGGRECKEAIDVYLNKYGMRCAGEIDITRPRWSEQPTIILPMLLSNIKKFEQNAGIEKFDQGLKEARQKEQELIEKLKQLPDSKQKTEKTKEKISLLRNFIGYREYPKYSIISRYFIYKQALVKEAAQLLKSNIIHELEDIYYLTFEEFHEAVCSSKVDYPLINKRKEEYRAFEKLTPPRVITSDGEIINGAYKRGDLPAGAIIGLAVSSGITEGRARVILKLEEANLEEGDILITRFTDPSWTPLFVSIKGLVTEVGGLMTHGAVIAREYGLPAVVGLEDATKLIKDGQRIRVNGTDGYVELL